MKNISLFLLNIYKLFFSSLLKTLFGGGCRFSPTCSEYGHQAVARFGAVKGTILTLSRVSRCHPFSEGGLDPVPTK